MDNIKNIFAGFKNLIFKDQKVESIAEERLKRCFECPKRKEYTCGLCGCLLAAKTRSLNSSCPDTPPKW